MKKFFIFFILVLLLTGCSSKTVVLDSVGNKTVTTTTDASKFTEAQSQAWEAYYSTLTNPPVIATITQPDGTVVSINSQIPPPTPVINQHQNQVIKPIEKMISTGIKVIGGGLVLREVVDAMQGVSITNSGDGSVTYDRSETMAVDTTTVEESGTINTDSNNNSSDNHIDNTEPVIVEKETVTTVEPEVVVVEKETVTTVQPEVVIVEPSYPPTNTETK